MTAMEMVRKFGIIDGGMKEGVRAMKITQNAKAALKIADQIRARKEEILAIVDEVAARRLASEAAAAQAVLDRTTALQNGAPFELFYHDGEILSGYTAYGPDAEMLLNLGIAKEITGWGAYIDSAAVAALGDSFTLAEAQTYMAPLMEKAAAQRGELEANMEEVRRHVSATGSPLKLLSWTEPCNGTSSECSLDLVSRWMDPDGSTRVERIHTY